MDAILLCAGLGTRLRPHTLTTPKPLLPIQGRPILDWTLGALPKGVDRVIVVTHYLGEQIDAIPPDAAAFYPVDDRPPGGAAARAMRCAAARAVFVPSASWY